MPSLSDRLAQKLASKPAESPKKSIHRIHLVYPVLAATVVFTGFGSFLVANSPVTPTAAPVAPAPAPAPAPVPDAPFNGTLGTTEDIAPEPEYTFTKEQSLQKCIFNLRITSQETFQLEAVSIAARSLGDGYPPLSNKERRACRIAVYGE